MLSVFILASHDAQAITRTLNALIGATVDGLVREVVLIADNGNELAFQLADDAGCGLVKSEDFKSAIQTAKGEWLMVLEAGALPEEGWAEVIANHIQSAGKPARFRRSPLRQRSLFQRLLQTEKPMALGCIIEKRAAFNLGNSSLASPQSLAKAAKLKPLLAALRPA